MGRKTSTSLAPRQQGGSVSRTVTGKRVIGIEPLLNQSNLKLRGVRRGDTNGFFDYKEIKKDTNNV